MEAQRTFFAESNLTLLCNVAASTFPAHTFNAEATVDRQRLYESMRATHTDYADEPLASLNKHVLRHLFVAVTTPRVAGGVPVTAEASARPNRPEALSAGTGIRDLDTHRRSVPTTFQARPEQTSLTPYDVSSVVDHSNRQDDRGTVFNDALQAYETTRAHDTPADRVDPVDFHLEAESEGLAGDEAVRRMEALMAAREVAPEDEAGGDAGGDGHADRDSADRQRSVADALVAFQAQADVVEERVDAEQARQSTEATHATQVFRERQVLGEEDDGVKPVGAVPRHTPLAPVAEEEEGDVTGGLGASISEVGAYWLDESVRTNLDKSGRPRLDPCAFEHALGMTREEQALDERLQVSAETLHEHRLVPPPVEYTHETHFLEVCSGDRVRTVGITETPYDFTVHFSSNRTMWRTYVTHEDDPIEIDTDHTDTIELRRSLGLRGPPRGDAPPSLGQPDGTFTVQLQEVGGANVDTVFRNVVALKVNTLQLYFPGTECTEYPYVLLELEDFHDMYRSTNNAVRKSFCKLYYDASNCPSLRKSKHHTYIPKHGEVQRFATPIASLDRLHVRVLTPYGELLSTAQDTYSLKTGDGSYDQFTSTPTPGALKVYLQHYIAIESIDAYDRVRFAQLEWYDQPGWQTWLTSQGTELLDTFDGAETKYLTDLEEAKTTDEKQRVRDAYTRTQRDFGFPTCPAEYVPLRDFLERPEGHEVMQFGETPTMPCTQYVTIKLPLCIDPDNGCTTSVVDLVPTADKPLPLLNGIMLHESRATNLSMTVVERTVDRVVNTSNV